MPIKETFDLNYIAEAFPKILGALPVTLYVTAAALVIGWIFGLVTAWGKVSGPAALKKILKVLTDIIRGIPVVVLLYIVYFGLPGLIQGVLGVNISGWPKQVFIIAALVIELMINSSEMFRSAYASVEKGQIEAARSLGYTTWQRFTHVLFPQGFYVILPNLGNAVLSMVQATALVYTLGIFDILGKARQLDVNASHTETLESYVICALIYWGMAVLITGLFKLLEKSFGKGYKTVGGAA